MLSVLYQCLMDDNSIEGRKERDKKKNKRKDFGPFPSQRVSYDFVHHEYIQFHTLSLSPFCR
jgi:hypothetical protein